MGKKWKRLPIAIGPNAPNNFDLIQFEELDDYELHGVDLYGGFNVDEKDIHEAIKRSNRIRGINVPKNGAASSKKDGKNKPGNDNKKKKKQPRKKNKKKNNNKDAKNKTSAEK